MIIKIVDTEFYYQVFVLFNIIIIYLLFIIACLHYIHKLLGVKSLPLSVVALFTIEDEVPVCTPQRLLQRAHQRAIIMVEQEDDAIMSKQNKTRLKPSKVVFQNSQLC